MISLGKWITAAASVLVLTGATYAPRDNTLNVYINGTGVARANVVCSWEAVVSGGTGLYTLSWTGGINGTPASGDRYFASTPSSGTFYINVTVTDSNGDSDTSTQPVRISSTAGPCLV
jgi:hypothetical protein